MIPPQRSPSVFGDWGSIFRAPVRLWVTTDRNGRGSGEAGLSRSLVVGSERLGEAPTVAKTFCKGRGSRKFWRWLATVATPQRLGGWHPNAPTLSPWRAGGSSFLPDVAVPFELN